MKEILIIFILLPLGIHAQEVTVHRSNTTVEITDLRHMTIRETKVMTIHDEDAYSYAVFKGADTRFTSVSSLKMTVYDSHGKKVKRLGKSNSNEYELNASNEITDMSLVILDPKFQQYPFKVELESEIKYNKGFMNISDWVPRDDFRVEVEQADLTLISPGDMTINIYSENIEEPEFINKDGQEVRKWQVKDLASIDHDISAKQFWDEQPKVFMSPGEFELDGHAGSFESWETYGNWFYDLNHDPYELTANTRSFLDNVNEPDLYSTVRTIYNYMQSQTRYVSIQLGIGGWQSLPAGFVDEKGFGDCKALSNYMRCMLDYKGISSNFVLVNAGDEVPNIKRNYLMNQFNHVFLGVPDQKDTIYLECTSQLMPTGYLGTFTDDRDVLWVGKNSSQIIRSPIYDEEDNVLRTQCEMKLDTYGNATLDIVREKGGYFYEDVQFFKSVNEKQRKEYVYDQFDFRDFIIKDFSYGELSGEAPVYATKVNIVTNNIARNTSDRLLLPVNIFPGADNYFTYNQFQHFAEIKRNFALEDQITVTLPENFFIDQLPEIPSISSEYCDYSCQVTDLEDGRIRIKRKVVIRKGEYKNNGFDDFNEFLNDIKKADRSKLIIQTGT